MVDKVFLQDNVCVMYFMSIYMHAFPCLHLWNVLESSGWKGFNGHLGRDASIPCIK